VFFASLFQFCFARFLNFTPVLKPFPENTLQIKLSKRWSYLLFRKLVKWKRRRKKV